MLNSSTRNRVLAAFTAAFAMSWGGGTVQAQAAPGLGTTDHEISGIQVTLLELKRSPGDTITARWRYSNSNPKKTQLTKGTGWTDGWKLAWDSYLIDAANKKKYLLLMDSEGKPIAAKHAGSAGGSINIEPGQSITTWAKYPAPPAGVKKISLYITGAPPFEDVLISQ